MATAAKRVLAARRANYVWDSNHSLPQLALERDAGGTLVRRYLYGQKRLTLTSGGSTSYYHDLLGSAANVTSATGSSQWTYAYEPYGVIRTETQHDPAAPQNPMKFAGELLDATGLYHLRARQYDAALGRFLQWDPKPPAPDEPYLAGYVYAANRPTVMVDPTGMTFTPANNYCDEPLDCVSGANLA